MKIFITILLIFFVKVLAAQETNSLIKDANDVYRKGDYKNAAELYKKVLGKDGKNNTANFNLANALLKQNNFEEAEKYYDQASEGDIGLQAKALYNKGLAQVQQQKLIEAIETFKQSLKMTPEDNDARENLQKAMNELKKQQQQQSPQNTSVKPKPQPDKKKQPDKQLLEQKFNELRDKEKQIQKMLQKKSNIAQPVKDW